MDQTATAIDTQSHVPYYLQLRSSLLEYIQERPPHEKLPSEADLERQFRVSRTVVRRALMELANEGYIYSRKGKGTFVSEPKIVEGQITGLGGFLDDQSRRGYMPTTTVLDQSIIEADASVARRLGIESGEPVARIERLRTVREVHLAHMETFLPYVMFPNIENEDLTDRSLYAVLRADYSVDVRRARRTLQLAYCSERVAEILDVPVNAPAITVESVSFSATGECVEYSIATHNGEKAKFEFEVESE